MSESNFREMCAELAKLARRDHYRCEDHWYSCPKSPDGCANDSAGDECNCGADSHNDKIDELLSLIALATQPPEPLRPIPVGERLPEPGEWVWHCYAGVRFWEHGRYYSLQKSQPATHWFFIGDGPESQPATHWLPANAIPFPEVTQ